MTELEMMNKLEEARIASTENNPFPVYAFSNGNDITWCREYNYKPLKKYLENKGYWICSIFVDGNRVEA